MIAMNAALLADRRLADRLDGLVRKTSSPRAFAAAGRVVLGALSAHGEGPAWARQLTEAMSGSLWLVQARTLEETDASFRVDLAAAATALAVVRPERRTSCLGAVRVWLGLGMSDPVEMTDPVTLARRALLALLVDDVHQAERCVAQLGVIELGGVGGALHDWVVARKQRHGAARERECLHHLRLALWDAPAGVRATLLLLGGVVADERAAELSRWTVHREEPEDQDVTDPAIRIAV